MKNNLVNYASFLYHTHLSEVSDLCQKQFYDKHLDLSFYTNPDKSGSSEFLQTNVKEFLKEAMEEKTTDALKKILSTIPYDEAAYQLNISQLIAVINNRKYILLNFLPLFTSNPNELLDIVLHIEDLFKTQQLLIVKNVERFCRKKISESREREELYLSFFKQSSLGVWRYEFKDISYIETSLPIDEQIQLISDHVFIAEANQFLADTFGLENPDPFKEKKIVDYFLISEEERLAFYRQGIQSGYSLKDIELTGMDLNGHRLYVEVSIIGIVKDGKLMGGWGILRNTTDKKFSDNALKASEERYRFLANSIPHIVWTAKADGKIDFINERWYDYTGASPDKDSYVENWLPYIHPDDVSNLMTEWSKCVQTGNMCIVEFRIRKANGTYRWHVANASALKDKNGVIVKWMGTSTDIDDQKKFIQILERKNKELAKINKDLDNFIYSVSHDLKAPISNIEGLSKNLEEGLTDECRQQDDVSTILTMIDSSIHKFKNNLLGLIEMAKAEKCSQEFFEETPLIEVFNEATLLIKDLIRSSDASVSADFSKCPNIRFPRRSLQSILYNLLSNAVKYRSPDKRPVILVETIQQEDYIILSVHDNGLGIPKDQIDKIFSHTHRLHSEIEGSGIGLFLIKKIITNAGGKIEVESELGKETVFRVYFKRS